LVDADDEIESVEITFAAGNRMNMILKGATQEKIKQTLTQLLSD
jgi:hypothetical protein